MSGNLLHVNATVMCPHGGQATLLPSRTRVLASGQPVATLADVHTIAGCAFNVSGKPQPCVTIKWVTPSARITLDGQPALLQSSVGLCQSAEQVPQGPPNVVVVQQRAVGR
ncbi:PAAR-like protein [Saccharothrix luteola]|uniref:PAAR-like protein n=1 Tax=Saccharothrix luteola TaxID=2893018 RepID=UPI001E51EEF5|nr:PAAR-like protein [Saccharothrix luteola]MCC8250472.1 DUF4280 domain-containing protein [Saccharothrix luteola]